MVSLKSQTKQRLSCLHLNNNLIGINEVVDTKYVSEHAQRLTKRCLLELGRARQVTFVCLCNGRIAFFSICLEGWLNFTSAAYHIVSELFCFCKGNRN